MSYCPFSNLCQEISLSYEPEFMSWQKVRTISSSHQSIWEAKSHLEIGLSLCYPKHLLETGVTQSLCRQNLLSESDLSRKDISWRDVNDPQDYLQAGGGAAIWAAPVGQGQQTDRSILPSSPQLPWFGPNCPFLSITYPRIPTIKHPIEFPVQARATNEWGEGQHFAFPPAMYEVSSFSP